MNNLGFTIVELMIVLTIIGIIMLIVVPDLASLGGTYRIQVEANKIAQDIRLTQQLAVVKGYDHVFELNMNENYYIVRSRNLLDGIEKVEHIDKSVSVLSCNFDSEAQYKVLKFSPTSIPGRTGHIELVDSFGNKKVINVAVGSGRVQIK